jgi:hypothetical protein
VLRLASPRSDGVLVRDLRGLERRHVHVVWTRIVLQRIRCWPSLSSSPSTRSCTPWLTFPFFHSNHSITHMQHTHPLVNLRSLTLVLSTCLAVWLSLSPSACDSLFLSRVVLLLLRRFLTDSHLLLSKAVHQYVYCSQSCPLLYGRFLSLPCLLNLALDGSDPPTSPLTLRLPPSRSLNLSLAASPL